MFGRKKIEELQKEIGSTISGSLIFGDYEQEMNAWNRERKIRDYREMMKDPTVEGLFNIVTMPILASEYQIVAEDEDENAKEQADFVRKNLFESSFKGGIETPFDLFLDEAMLALADGFAVWEKVYRLNKDGKLELKKLALRDSLSVELEAEKGEYVGVKQTLEDGGVVEIPAYKTFLFTHNKKFNRLYGRSILNSLYKNYDKKQKLEYLDSIALQNDAIKPKILTETQEHLGVGSGAMRKIIHAIGKFGKTNSAVSVPFGYDIKTLESDGRDPHQSIERQKSEMAFAFMANFMLLGAQGKSSSGSYALSNTQAGIFQMSLQSILDKLEAHINQYIIADLIDLNFAEPHYPQFKFAKLDKSKIESIFEIFKKMVDKDKVSDEVVKQVEDEVANQLGFQIENKKQLNLSENEPTTKITPPDKHFSNLDKKWQDIENRFLDQSRTIFESVAKGIKETGKIELSKEYKDLLIKIFKQAYTEGKIFSANREGRKAGKDSPEFSKNAKEYINWIFEKQENDLKQFLESESWNDTLLAEDSSDFLRNLATGVLIERVISWFLKRAKPTASYLVGRGVNAGIYSDFKPDDLIEYSAIIDGHTTAGCSYLNGKKMTWQEWQKNPDMIPPRHFGCRATLVRVVEGGDDSENPVDKKLLERKDDFAKTPKGELIARGELDKDETKKAGLARIRNEEFVLPNKTKIPPQLALSGTNPNYDKAREYQINCQRCVPTYEMRRRGYDVEALGNLRGSVKLGNLEKMKELWSLEDKDILRNYIEIKRGENITIKDADFGNVLDFIEDSDIGSRFQISWWWSKNRAGHTVVAENTRKGAMFIDPQIGKTFTTEQFWRLDKNKRKMFLFRIDNRKINEDMLKLIMKGKNNG
uniref:Portal protein n=1 Tax=Myoviridae sp. ctMnh10 TaxID=2827682 RepID=A0A8S5THB2_9CAUD|nr:MAG TPA: Portal protein [Myoviridae sp. ctMnh10]